MKPSVARPAHFAITAGLCTSLTFGGMPVEAIAAEIDSLQSATVSAQDAAAVTSESQNAQTPPLFENSDLASRGDEGTQADYSLTDDTESENETVASTVEDDFSMSEEADDAGAYSANQAALAFSDESDADSITTLANNGSVATEQELIDALASAKDGDTVVLSGNIELASALTISKNIVLDLSGFTLSCPNLSGSGAKPAVKVSSTTSGVQIQNGTITSNREALSIEGNSCTVQNCKLSSSGAGKDVVSISGTDAGTTTTIDGCEITCAENGKAISKVYSDEGNLTLKGTCNINGKISVPCNSNSGSYVVRIEDGFYNAGSNVQVFVNPNMAGGLPELSKRLQIVSGHFAVAPEESLIDAASECVDSVEPGYPFEVTLSNETGAAYVLQDNGTKSYYETLEAALDAAQGATVHLVRSCTVADVSKLAGATIEGKAGVSLLCDDATLTQLLNGGLNLSSITLRCKDATVQLSSAVNGKLTEGTVSKSDYLCAADVLADGYLILDQAYRIVPESQAEAKIGRIGFESLDAAVITATSDDQAGPVNEEIVLLRNVRSGKADALSVYFPSATFTLDLNGYSLSGTGSSSGGLIVAPLKMGSGSEYLPNNASITVKNGTIEARGYGVATNGRLTNVDIVLQDVSIHSAKYAAMYLPAGGSTQVTGCTLEGKTGIQLCGGSLTVDNSKVYAAGNPVEKTDSDGYVQDGAAISVISRDGYAAIGKVEINSGEFNSIPGLTAVQAYAMSGTQDSVWKGAGDSIDIAAGTFSSEIATDLLSAGRAEFVAADGTSQVLSEADAASGAEAYVEKDGVKVFYASKDAAVNSNPDIKPDEIVERLVSVGQKTFFTVGDALETASQTGEAIVLNGDITENVTVTAGQSVTLDLNGHTLTAPVTNGKNLKSTITVEGSLVLKDSTATAEPKIQADGTIVYASGSVVCPSPTVSPYARPVSVEPGGMFTLESGRLYAKDSDGVFVGTPGASLGGTMVMKGGLIDAQEYGIGVISHSSLTVEGGMIRARDNAAVAGNGTVSPADRFQGDTNITISGGTLRGENEPSSNGYIACAIYHPQSGTLTITGGTIEAVDGVAILMRAGSANITGGTITGTGNVSGYVGDSKLQKVPSSGIVVDRAANYDGATPEDVVNISGDASVSADAEQQALSTVLDENDSKDGLIAVSGGSLSTKPDPEYCAEGYVPTERPDGSFGVTTEQSYTVEHLFEAIDSDGFAKDETLAKTETLTGTIGENTAAAAQSVVGFTPETVTQKKIAADGSTVVQIKYKRVRHTITFDLMGGTGESGEHTVKHGATAVSYKDPVKEGYEFLGWFLFDAKTGTWGAAFDATAPVTGDMLVGAKWKKIEDGNEGSTEKPAEKPTKPADKPASKPSAGDKGGLAQTGDSTFAQIAAAVAAGIATLGAGLGFRRRRDS